jgi:hypothetical protein
VFIGPLDDKNEGSTPEAKDLVLFLYRIAVNAQLRNAERRVPSNHPSVPPVVHTSALPLELFYLLTGGNADTGGEPNALGVLGRAMQVLNDTPELTGAAVQNDIVRLTLDPIGSEEMSRIWTLFPTANYRTSVVYVASPVWLDPETTAPSASPVVEEPHRFSQRPRGAFHA